MILFSRKKLIEFPQIQTQTDGVSCGYFAIMSFVSFLFGINPESIRIKKTKLLQKNDNFGIKPSKIFFERYFENLQSC